MQSRVFKENAEAYHAYMEQPEVTGADENSLMTMIFKFKSLLRRYHTHLFVDAHMQNYDKRHQVIDKFRSTLEGLSVDWKKFRVVEEPRNDLDEAMNFYQRFEFQ